MTLCCRVLYGCTVVCREMYVVYVCMANSRQCVGLGTQSKWNQTHATAQLQSSIYFSILHGLQLMSSVVLDAFVMTCSLHQFRAQICHKPWRAKSLRLAAAYTSYGAADKILRRLTAYEVYGGLWRRLGALTTNRKSYTSFRLVPFLMTLKYVWRSFQPRLLFPHPFQQSLACFRVARSPSNSWPSCYSSC